MFAALMTRKCSKINKITGAFILFGGNEMLIEKVSILTAVSKLLKLVELLRGNNKLVLKW